MHFHQWKRREFMRLLGGAAASWPLAARAQQTAQMRRISVLMSADEADPRERSAAAAFVKALGKLGQIEGRMRRLAECRR
jgi:putative ABC transport system substrate-binding protein